MFLGKKDDYNRGVPASQISDPKPIFSLPSYPPPTSFCIIIMIFIISVRLFMVLIIYNYSRNTTYLIFMRQSRIPRERWLCKCSSRKKSCYCGCGFETTALSDYHTAGQAMTANKMQRLHSQLLSQGCTEQFHYLSF